MATFAIAMVKDEADVVEASVRRMAGEVDHLVVADNASTDGTRELLEQLAGELPLTVLHDPELAYYQSRKMTALAAAAAQLGADWVVPFDADERWYSPFGRIADVLAAHGDAAIAPASLYDHVPTADDDAGTDPIVRIGWRRRDPTPLCKVACRARVDVVIHQGNHGATHPSVTRTGLLYVRHFPYRSPEQMIRKARNGAAAYAATSLPEHEGQHWRDYGRLSDEQLGDVFREHFWSPAPHADDALIFDPAP